MSPRATALLVVILVVTVVAAVWLRNGRQDQREVLQNDPAAQAKIVFRNVCATCHGTAGEGNPELKSPSIASLPDWYIASQLRKFHADVRGAEPGDVAGAQMRAIAHTLNADLIDNIALVISKLPVHPTQNTLGGDPEKGKETFQLFCEECHRSNASGDFVFKSPPLTGLQDWYLAIQLNKFREGIRGGHPRDLDGAKMLIPSGRFLNREDETNVLAYIAFLANRPLRKE